MKDYIKLLRPRDWVKNLILFAPSFFAGQFFVFAHLLQLLEGFVAFCFFSSGIYIINDYQDVEEDRKHPIKYSRPLAAGTVKKPAAGMICILLLVLGVFLGWEADPQGLFLLVLGLYFFFNLCYSLGFKNIAILDILILSMGFVLRVRGGAIISRVETSEWLIIMTFLLSLFMAIAKRRDDLLLKNITDIDMRKSLPGYNLDFLNTLLGLSSAIIIVAYINYTVSPVTIQRLGTNHLFYSGLFVIAGLMRYLQITFVLKKSGSPTEILFKDLFMQIILALWVLSIYVILYLRDTTIFGK
jgi:decaprenyl-phosphate phosphoribosyltransferase